MSAIRARNTQPERVVRSALHRVGFRFRLHSKRLPGKPDLVFPKYRAVIFVHGCFWHQHRCLGGRKPATNPNYWLPKLRRNKDRDVAARRALRDLGWRSLVVWECELRNIDTVVHRACVWLRELEP